MSKEKVLEYCDQFKMPDVKHIEDAIENACMIRKGKYRYLNGCPNNYGLDDYVGLCEDREEGEVRNLTSTEFDDLCEACWKKALGVK